MREREPDACVTFATMFRNYPYVLQAELIRQLRNPGSVRLPGWITHGSPSTIPKDAPSRVNEQKQKPVKALHVSLIASFALKVCFNTCKREGQIIYISSRLLRLSPLVPTQA